MVTIYLKHPLDPNVEMQQEVIHIDHNNVGQVSTMAEENNNIENDNNYNNNINSTLNSAQQD